MLDIKFIKENPDLVRLALKKKHLTLDLDRLLLLEGKRVELLQKTESLRAKQNAATDEIAKAEPEKKKEMIEAMKAIKADFSISEAELQGVMAEWRSLMLQVPNIPDVSVPEGESDAQNVEVRTWGVLPTFSFTPKNQTELIESLDMGDFERGTKVAGFRGYILKNDGVFLANAVAQLALAHFAKKGLSPMMVPSLVRKETLFGTGYLPQGEEDLYKTQDGDYLAGTGEVATMAYYMDEVLSMTDLPKRMLAMSPCFRREAGSHGKDTKGLVRVHEFFKLEQVVLCEANHEQSVEFHEELTRNSEEFLQALNLPYRVVLNCGGDLGLGQVKKYDIEVWVPSESKYRETHSSSYFHDFQTRRLNIRYRDAEGKMRFVHSLNNTAIAIPRVLVPIMENYQQEDGTIRVPEALKPYIGKSILNHPSKA